MTTTSTKTPLVVPDSEMKDFALSSVHYANSYFNSFSKSLSSEESRFDNDLLYQMAIMSAEKYFVALLARFDQAANHRVPVAMYEEAKTFEPELTPEMYQTCTLISKYESVCAVDGFGYRIPAKAELHEMAKGLGEIKKLVEKRLAEI